MRFHSSAAEDRADDQPTCNLYYIRRQLGRQNYGDRRMVTYVGLLIDRHGFPPPLPTLVRAGLVTGVTSDSRWHRGAVDAWLDDFLPPDNSAQVDRAALTAAASEMDNAAGHLQLIRGGRT